MEGKHIKNDNFHPIIQFRKGQTFLAKSSSIARLSAIAILQCSWQHSEIICLPTGIAATVTIGLFPKQRRKEESSVSKLPKRHNHLNTVGNDLANASELGAYYHEYPY